VFVDFVPRLIRRRSGVCFSILWSESRQLETGVLWRPGIMRA